MQDIFISFVKLKTKIMENTKTLAPENTEQPGTDTSFSRSTTSHLGTRIRAIRKMRDMKQETLGASTQLTQAKISFIENTGVVEPKMLQKIVDALGVTVDFLENFNPEESVYQVQNNYNAQRVGLEFNDDESTTTNSHNTNSLDVIQHMSDTIKESYTLVIAEQKKMINELKVEILELKNENKELRTKK